MKEGSPLAADVPFSLSDSDLTREQKEYLQGLLHDGETLLWAGMPKARVPLASWLVSIPAAIFCAYVCWAWGRGLGQMFMEPVKPGQSLVPWLIAALLLLMPGIIFCAAVGSPLWKLFLLRRTLYAVTDRRYLSAVNYPCAGWRVKEWTGEPLEVIRRDDVTGDVVLEYRTVPLKGGGVSHDPLGLLGIPDFKKVRLLLGRRAVADGTEGGAAAQKAGGTKPRTLKIWAFVLMALGSCVLAFVLKNACSTYDSLSALAEVEGMVTHLERQTTHGKHGSHNTYRAHYRFEAGGKEYSGMQQTFSSPPSYAKGEKLTVLYNPADPQESYPDNLLDNYFGCLVGGVFGLVTLLIGLSYLLASRLQARKTAQ